MIRVIRLLCSLVLTAALVVAMVRSGNAQETNHIPVIATFSILGDLVANVGGDHIDLTTFIEGGADPHTWEPNPEQVVELTEAALIFENGLDFEPWLDDIYEPSGSEAARIVVSDGISLLDADGEHGTSHGDEDGHEDEDGHDHGEIDPHVWQSASNAMIMVENIRDALVETDPANAAEYEANATAYLTQLQTLDNDIVAKVDTVPQDQRKLVTSHDTFGYYADRYGFVIVGSALGSTTEGADPSAADIAELIEVIEGSGVAAIFPENTTNPSIIEQIAAETSVAIGPPLYTDSLGEPGTLGDTYIKMMRFNTESIVEALNAAN